MNKIGLVVKTEKGTADVMVVRSGACGGKCSSCAGCESKPLTVNLPNTIDATVGDRVEIVADANRILQFTVMMYAIPIALFIGGVVATYVTLETRFPESVELYSLLGGVVGFVLSLVILRLIDNRMGKQETMTLSRIIKEEY